MMDGGFNSYIYIDYEWHLNLRHYYGVAEMTGHMYLHVTINIVLHALEYWIKWLTTDSRAVYTAVNGNLGVLCDAIKKGKM